MNTIHRMFVVAAGLAAVAGVVVGCNDTAEGVEKDSAEISRDAAKTAERAKNATADSAANAIAAAELTPRIKAAIIANPALNDPDNQIDVDADDDVVYLRGFVTSETLKATAEDLARQILKETAAKQTLHSELRVR